jgi:hypothetical protein
MSPQSRLSHPFGNGGRPGTFSAWTMAIVFVTVALISFAVDQAIVPLPAEDQSGVQPPSLLHPVLLIETLIDAAASNSGDHAQ